MAGEFKTRGRALIANGFLIIPIKPGHKRPALSQWETSRLSVFDLDSYPTHGVGVLTGQGAQPIAAIDIDTTDAALAERFVQWCRENLGNTCERIGKAPKILLAYRAAGEGWGKATGAWFEDLAGDRHRLEVLGKGQQFVAYHIHPDTQAPYEWIDLLGGIEYVNALELPIITEDQVEAAVLRFEEMAAEAGLSKVVGSTSSGVTSPAVDDDPLMAHEPPIELTLAQAIAHLRYLDNTDYDAWLRAGMALHHQFDGSLEALDAWDEWSSAAPNYTGRDDLALRWAGFGQRSRRPTTARWLVKVATARQRESERSEKRDGLSNIKCEIELCTDSIDLVNEVARRAGEVAGSDLAVKSELLGLLRSKFRELTGTPLAIADARIALAGGKKNVQRRARREMTELGNACRLLDHYGEGLMYVPELDQWFAWTGVYWRRAHEVELQFLAKQTIRGLVNELADIESDEERAAFFKFCATSQQARMVFNMVSLAKSENEVAVRVPELDSHRHLLGVANGAVDLRTGELIPPHQAHRITTISPVEYDPGARAPLWEQTLLEVFSGNAEMVAFFQRLVGYALRGDPTEDILVIPYGSGSNGKSTVLGAIREVLGPHSKVASPETFLTARDRGNNAGQAREDVLRLRGSRFVYVMEPDEGAELREGMVKSMTGGDAISARGLYSKTTVEVFPSWVIFMPTNHMPIIKGDDVAIWRRLMPVPFTRNFENDPVVEKDLDRADRLRSEARGILRWCVEGCRFYVEQGLRPPADVSRARQEYKDDMDLLRDWLAECCELVGDGEATLIQLWASWKAFAESRNELRYIGTPRNLARRLGARFEKRSGHSRTPIYRGIKVRIIGDFN